MGEPTVARGIIMRYQHYSRENNAVVEFHATLQSPTHAAWLMRSNSADILTTAIEADEPVRAVVPAFRDAARQPQEGVAHKDAADASKGIWGRARNLEFRDPGRPNTRG